ncbi:MAG: AI-2E family transporter [Acidothermus sp.]|nr:AI-2E family transporter [Acidothermus sp.]
MATPPTTRAGTARSRTPTSEGGAADLFPSTRDSLTEGEAAAGVEVPHWLRTAGAWSWRLLVSGIVAYFVLRFLVRVQIVVLPFLGAMVMTALLRPLCLRLERRGLPRLVATWATFLIALVVVFGVGAAVVYRTTVEWHTLVSDLSATADKVRHWLATGPLHLRSTNLKDYQQQIVDALKSHRGLLVSEVVSGASVAGEIGAGLILTAFTTFFLLYEGERIWQFLLLPLRPPTARRVDVAARAAWQTLSGYIRGSVLIASFHAVVMAISLLVLHVPLVAPLAVITFITSFIPLVGVLVGGGLSVFVTLGTQGLVAGIILLVILVVEHQVEGHLLQPFIMGRAVRLHPLAVALALAAGTVLGGIIGAIVAVPVLAMVKSAWPHLWAPRIDVPSDFVSEAAPRPGGEGPKGTANAAKVVNRAAEDPAEFGTDGEDR